MHFADFNEIALSDDSITAAAGFLLFLCILIDHLSIHYNSSFKFLATKHSAISMTTKCPWGHCSGYCAKYTSNQLNE